jgi:AcrR family transcriptional regulator
VQDEVKPRRRYDSPRRRQQADLTRQAILAAAGTLFRDRGYSGTTMTAIADAAEVVVETVYRSFGSKRAVFRAVVEAVLAGGVARAGVPVEERPAIRAVIEEPDPRRKVALYAATQPGIHRRSGPLLRALQGGMAADPELRAVWDELEHMRLEGQGRFAAMLAGKGALRPGLSVEEARDRVWTLCSLAVHDLLVVERGWSAEAYQAWLTEALSCSILAGPEASSPP